MAEKKTTKKATKKRGNAKETDIHRLVAKAYDIRGKHLDFFFLAFLEETGLKPSEVELVEKTVEGSKGKEIRWHFREVAK